MTQNPRAPMELNSEQARELIADRRMFHRIPELGYCEEKTSSNIAERLDSLGYEVTTGIGKTGVVGLMASKDPQPEAENRTLLYRADMDALPIQEENDVDYSSEHPGVMHACGHDAHIAIGLAVARRLAEERDRLSGNLKFAFQPAEEGGKGALAMIEDGVLQNPEVTATVGLHVWNNLPIGKVGIYTGALMAAVDEFHLTIEGKGGHGAMPHQTVDAIVTAAHVITSLQTIVSRNIAPLDPAVVTVGAVSAGTAFNVIAGSARLRGTVRTFDKETYTRIPLMIERVIKGVCDSMGATYEFEYKRQTLPLVNRAEIADLVAECAGAVVGPENVVRDESVRTMGGEDMSYFLERVPGCYFFLGSRNEALGKVHPHHSPKFDIDESALAIGAEIMTRVAYRYLKRQ